jgi:Disulphide bond corrector protein DsbC
LKGHGFSRAITTTKGMWALAPEGMQVRKIRNVVLTFALAACTTAIFATQARAQSDSTSRSILKGAAVEYLYPEQVSVPANKPTEVTLHFQVAQGLHINSHSPKEEFLIPTTFSIPDGAGVKLETATYPVGKDFVLPSDPGNKLSVYTEEFTIQARIVAPAGNHLVEAKLRFQACDKSVCLPPKTIPVAIDVIGK